MMRQKIAALQKELKEKEQELKIKHRSEDHVESGNEEDKGDCAIHIPWSHLEFGLQECMDSGKI